MGKQRSTFARELDRLVDKKNPDGTPRYTPKDIHALRSMLLLEIARRGNAEVEKLSDSSRVELSFALELIGITPHTNPALIMGMVEKYYRELGINPEIIIEFNDLLTMLGKQKDRVEAVEQTQKAYDKMMEKDGPKAPKADDPVPEDSEQAQTLTLNLGGKVRI